MTLEQAVETIKGMTAHELTGMLHHAPVSLDGFTSPGANFLLEVRDKVAEKLEDDPANVGSDSWQHEAADGAVPIYTYEAWKTFIDLQGWESDHVEEVSGLTTESAQAVLYYLADEVIHALLDHIRDVWDEEEDSDIDDEYDREYAELTEEIPPNAGSVS